MRCVICGRAIKTEPALMVGLAAFGPKCARRAGLIKPKGRKSAADVVRDERTRDWVQEEMHGRSDGVAGNAALR